MTKNWTLLKAAWKISFTSLVKTWLKNAFTTLSLQWRQLCSTKTNSFKSLVMTPTPCSSCRMDVLKFTQSLTEKSLSWIGSIEGVSSTIVLSSWRIRAQSVLGLRLSLWWRSWLIQRWKKLLQITPNSRKFMRSTSWKCSQVARLRFRLITYLCSPRESKVWWSRNT